MRASVVPEEAMISEKTFLDLDLDISFCVPSREPICVKDREKVGRVDTSFCVPKVFLSLAEDLQSQEDGYLPLTSPSIGRRVSAASPSRDLGEHN